MKQSETPNLTDITRTTLDDYERNAASFWEGTKDHDVAQNYAALLAPIEAPAPFTLLDFGCGPGRDLAYFASLGHHPVGLDGCAAFCEMARAHSKCEVLEQNFVALDLPPLHFDGIFANASLFHVPSLELPGVLAKLRASLKRRGVFFASNPRGTGEEGFRRARYGCFYDWEGWSARVREAGFEEITHYYRPSGVPFAQQNWLASVWRNP